MSRAVLRVELWRMVIPALWLGMLIAISFIEAPLKFQAPGITIPLGLGIGRLVFTALNIAEACLLLVTLILALVPKEARVSRKRLSCVAAVVVLYLVKVAIVRPPLNARTDLVLAGAEPGQSLWHYFYIACDLVTVCLLVWLIVLAARSVLAVAAVPLVARSHS